MTANLYYDCNGESWTILDFHSSITFSSERAERLIVIWRAEI